MGRAHGPYTAVYTSRYGPYTAVYTTRYTAVYGHVDGRFRPCRWPVHGRLHGPCTHRHVYAAVYVSCTRPCARPVHGRVHDPCTGPCTRHVHGRRRPYTGRVHRRVHGWCRRAMCTAHTRPCLRAMYTAEDVRTRAVYTAVYTGGVDGPCARPIHGRVRAVYTARPLYGRVRAVFAGEDVFTGRVHGRRVTGTRHVRRPCTRPYTRHVTRPCTWQVRGRTTAVYTAVQHGRGRPVHGRVTAV